MSTVIHPPAGFIPAVIDLAGLGGNAMFLIGDVRGALRRAGNPREVVDAFTIEAMSGDYDHVLQTCIAYTSCS